MKKTVYFETLGCPKNEYDSLYAAGILEKAGYAIVPGPSAAGFIVVNTCGFIEDAKRESIGAILEMAAYKNGGCFLIATGCLTQRYGDELLGELPEIDAYLGVGEYERLPDILDSLLLESGQASECQETDIQETGKATGDMTSEAVASMGMDLPVESGVSSERQERDLRETGKMSGGMTSMAGADVDMDLPVESRVTSESQETDLRETGKMSGDMTYAAGAGIDIDLPGGANGGYSYLKIADGCDNRCTYCIIPYIRGPYISRKIEEIVSEANDLVAAGAKEIILIAQDVTAYGMDIYGMYKLPDLIRELCRIDGLIWLRLMYCYEDRITDELIRVMAEEEKVCNYIDLPLQHVSDKILKAMGRRSTKASILDTVGRLRAAMPDISIRTTFITGFPGESKDEFDELVSFLEEVPFNRMGVFTYSREEGTPASVMAGQVRRDVKARRLDRLMKLQQRVSLDLNRKLVGRTVEAVIEAEEEDGSFLGRTCYDAPEIDNGIFISRGDYVGELKRGDMVRVMVNDALDYDLYGVIK